MTTTTATLVQASADVITVVTLRKGDVYKRLTNAYGGANYDLSIGIVVDVMHNGTDAVVTALEFGHAYGSAEVKLQTFGTGSDLKLFPADPEEVRAHLGDVQEAAARSVKAAEDALAKAHNVRRQVSSALEQYGEPGKLTAAPTVRPGEQAALEPTGADARAVEASS